MATVNETLIEIRDLIGAFKAEAHTDSLALRGLTNSVAEYLRDIQEAVMEGNGGLADDIASIEDLTTNILGSLDMSIGPSLATIATETTAIHVDTGNIYGDTGGILGVSGEIRDLLAGLQLGQTEAVNVQVQAILQSACGCEDVPEPEPLGPGSTTCPDAYLISSGEPSITETLDGSQYFNFTGGGVTPPYEWVITLDGVEVYRLDLGEQGTYGYGEIGEYVITVEPSIPGTPTFTRCTVTGAVEQSDKCARSQAVADAIIALAQSFATIPDGGSLTKSHITAAYFAASDYAVSGPIPSTVVDDLITLWASNRTGWVWSDIDDWVSSGNRDALVGAIFTAGDPAEASDNILALLAGILFYGAHADLLTLATLTLWLNAVFSSDSVTLVTSGYDNGACTA